MGKWLGMLAAVVLVATISCAKAANNQAAPEYRQWTLVQSQKLVTPLAQPTVLSIQVQLGAVRTYVKDTTREDSPWMTEYEILGKVVVRTGSTTNGALQMLVGGKWLNGKNGAVPNVYLLDPAALFEKNQLRGVRLEMEGEDGTLLKTEVTP